jgi:hypothetical protein
VALQFPVEGCLLLLHRIVSIQLAPCPYLRETALEAFPHRPNVKRELPFPASSADMRKSEEVESGRLRPTRLFRFRQGLPPELYQSSLFRVELQTVFRESPG